MVLQPVRLAEWNGGRAALSQLAQDRKTLTSLPKGDLSVGPRPYFSHCPRLPWAQACRSPLLPAPSSSLLGL